MKKYITLALLASFASLPTFAEIDTPEEETTTEEQTSEFMSDERLEEGFLTHYLNNAISQSMNSSTASPDEKMEYGRTVTDWISAPKFGGYVVGTYKYNGGDETNQFDCRYVRLYVDGTILKDFKYRLQLQVNGSNPHVKDFFIDWSHWKEFGVKIGQYKRSFTFENPYNPWDVGTGDYSQLTKKFAGMGDIVGEPSTPGGRDQGIQVHGDLFPISKDKHRLVHYELGIYNGQGINTGDKNKRKDFIGSIQFQPIKNLFIGGFYWNGDYVNADNKTLDRNRYCFGAKYETTEWSARMEYARECSDKYDGADALYLTAGIPCTPWLKTYVKYDLYRFDGTNDTAKTIYTVAPNFQLHKNLMFQVQYNFVHENYISKDFATLSKNHSEFWLETYVRF